VWLASSVGTVVAAISVLISVAVQPEDQGEVLVAGPGLTSDRSIGASAVIAMLRLKRVNY
jgi:hypothetical protein